MNLNERAMLITLSISCWTGARKDDNVVREVDAAHGAKNSGRFSKFLIDQQELKACVACGQMIRQFHYKNTLPWLDNGARMLPAKMFRAYDQEMRRMQSEYQKVTDAFLTRYETVLRPAAQSRLGSLYNDKDFPSVRELRTKFGVSTDIAPVPSSADFRVDIGDEQVQRIRAELDERMAERQRKAVADAFTRIRDTVGNVLERLASSKPVIRDSLSGNLDELLALLPGLNVTDNPLIASLSQEIASDLIMDLALLRKSQKERTRVAEIAKRILAKVPNDQDASRIPAAT